MEATYQKERGGTLLCECHGEHHLPDYAGDMKKILSTSAHILPAGKFIGGEEVQFGGTVCYDVWYLDAEDRLTHEAFSTDYEFSCPCGCGAVDGSASVSVAHYTLRPSGPRRISAKATLQAVVCLREKATYVCECEAEEARLHTMQKSLEIGERIFSAPMEREYAESLSIPVSYARGAEIIFSEGHVQLENAVAEADAILVHGNYTVAVILAADGLAPLRIAGSYPFEERLPLDGCTDEMAATANGYFTSLTCSIREGEGEECAVTFHGICEITGTAERNVPVSVVADAFVEGESGTCEQEELIYDTFGPAEVLCRTVELRLPLPEGEDTLDGVFHTVVSLKNETRTAADAEIAYSAEAEINALCYALDADGAVHCASQKQSAPFALTLPLHAPLLSDGKIFLGVRVGACEGYLDEGALCIRFCLHLCVQNYAEREASCVRRITSCASENGVFVPTYAVYYPSAGDSLWSIAKRYGVSPAAIAACNHLTAETSSLGSQSLPKTLLIDQRRK